MKDNLKNSPVENPEKQKQNKCSYNNRGYHKYEIKCRINHPEKCKKYLNEKKV